MSPKLKTQLELTHLRVNFVLKITQNLMAQKQLKISPKKAEKYENGPKKGKRN